MVSDMNKKIVIIEKKILKLKKELMNLGELRPGSLVQNFNVCGKKNCRCKDSKKPMKHGPYSYAIYMRKGKKKTTFIQSHYSESVKIEIENYKRLRRLVDEWIDLGLELSLMKMVETKPSVSK